MNSEPEIYRKYKFGLFEYFTRGIIWSQRKFFAAVKTSAGINPLSIQLRGEAANQEIIKGLESDQPFMVGRYGGIELDAISRGYYISRKRNIFSKVIDIFRGEAGPFWWDNSIRRNMEINTGFFPTDNASLMRYSKLSCEDGRVLDMLAVYPWANGLNLISKEYFPYVKTCHLADLEFYKFKCPWTKALSGRKVLVIHPFSDSISKQYLKRKEIWHTPEMLPEFELHTIKAISTLAGEQKKFQDWFSALDYMKNEIASQDFDVAIIGCGAYGFSLAAFVKRDLGKKAIHLGGITQILFGIRGGRWDALPIFNHLYNSAWIRPSESETPKRSDLVENSCYW